MMSLKEFPTLPNCFSCCSLFLKLQCVCLIPLILSKAFTRLKELNVKS